MVGHVTVASVSRQQLSDFEIVEVDVEVEFVFGDDFC